MPSISGQTTKTMRRKTISCIPIPISPLDISLKASLPSRDRNTLSTPVSRRSQTLSSINLTLGFPTRFLHYGTCLGGRRSPAEIQLLTDRLHALSPSSAGTPTPLPAHPMFPTPSNYSTAANPYVLSRQGRLPPPNHQGPDLGVHSAPLRRSIRQHAALKPGIGLHRHG